MSVAAHTSYDDQCEFHKNALYSERCPVCTDSFVNVKSHIVHTKCGHYFCYDCVHQWMGAHDVGTTTCPACRQVLAEEKSGEVKFDIMEFGREVVDLTQDEEGKKSTFQFHLLSTEEARPILKKRAEELAAMRRERKAADRRRAEAEAKVEAEAEAAAGWAQMMEGLVGLNREIRRFQTQHGRDMVDDEDEDDEDEDDKNEDEDEDDDDEDMWDADSDDEAMDRILRQSREAVPSDTDEAVEASWEELKVLMTAMPPEFAVQVHTILQGTDIATAIKYAKQMHRCAAGQV